MTAVHRCKNGAGRLSRAGLLCFLSTLTASVFGAETKFELVSPTRLIVTGVPETERTRFSKLSSDGERKAVFRVTVAKSGDTATPMLGSFEVKADAVVFKPRFPLRPGVLYRLQWVKADGTSVTSSVSVPQEDQIEPKVMGVFPTGNVLPENLLKFYIHFSRPMEQGDAYQYIRLFDRTSNQEVRKPFLELGEELWDPSGKRFTLYFDPGRIKRGLEPRRLLGPALEVGHEYELIVASNWRASANSKPLPAAFRKRFRVVEPDDQIPNYREWKLVAPKAGSRAPLTINLGESLDHALLQRMLVVTGPDGRSLQGVVKTSKDQQRWQFTPKADWPKGICTVKIDTRLEDLAGNSVAKPFEVDMVEEVTDRIPQTVVTRRFRVK